MRRYLFLLSAVALIFLAIWGGNYLLGGLSGSDSDDGGAPSGDRGGDSISVLPGGGFGSGGGSDAVGGGEATDTANGGEEADFPLRPQSGFGVIVNQEVADYAVEDDDTLLFIEDSGQVARVSGSGLEVLSSVAISNLRYARFSPDNAKVVVVFGSATTPQVSVFDVQGKSWEPLFVVPSSNPMWAPNDHRLAYITEDNDILALEIIDVDDANPRAQRLTTLPFFDAETSWKSNGELFVSERATAFAEQDMFIYDIGRRSLSPFLTREPGLVYLWDTLLDRGAVFTSVNSLRGGALDLIDGDGSRTQRFSFVALPRDKCSFAQLPNLNIGFDDDVDLDEAESHLLCALPQNTSGYLNYDVPDEYWQGRVNEPERIVSISLFNGTFDVVSGRTDGLFDATNIKLGHDVLYFVNGRDSKIYGLDFATH